MPPPSNPSLGDQLRTLIRVRGLSRYALGKASDVDPRVIGRFLSCERGITIGTPDEPGPADRLAAALNLQLVERPRAQAKKPPAAAKPQRSPLPLPLPLPLPMPSPLPYQNDNPSATIAGVCEGHEFHH